MRPAFATLALTASMIGLATATNGQDIKRQPAATIPPVDPVVRRQETTTAPTPLTCLTTSFISTTWCSTSTVNGSKQSSCIPTTTPSVGCNAGLICSTTEKGVAACMVRKDMPPIDGLIASIVLALFAAGLFGSLIFMSCRSRIATRRAARQKEAILIASGSKTGNAAASEAHLPLMYEQAPSGNQREVSTDYNPSQMRGVEERPGPHRVPSGTYSEITASRVPSGVPPRGSPGFGPTGGYDQVQNPFHEGEDLGYAPHRQL